MNVHVHFSAEIASALSARAAASGKDVSQLVEEMVVESLVEAEPDDSSIKRRGKLESVRERLRAFARLHPQVDRPLDVSREAIYAGRRECTPR